MEGKGGRQQVRNEGDPLLYTEASGHLLPKAVDSGTLVILQLRRVPWAQARSAGFMGEVRTDLRDEEEQCRGPLDKE